MIAVSSFRPLGESAEVTSNQLRAISSWVRVFDGILLFGEPERDLTHSKIAFLPSEQFPRIATLAMAAFMTDDFACLLNADIVVNEALVPAVRDVISGKGVCLLSRRYQFDPRTLDYQNAKVVDMGLDLFGAKPDVWRGVAEAIPSQLRIGHNQWDSWVLGYFNTMHRRQFYEITGRKAVFHPKHQERKRAYEISLIDDRYTTNMAFPQLRL